MRRLIPPRPLAALLAASFGLRVWLAFLGGQYFWLDEMRTSVEFYRVAHSTRSIAANRIGGSTCDPAFSGLVLATSVRP